MIHHSTEQTLGYSRRDKSEEIDIVQAQRPKINVRTSFEEPPEWGFSRCRSFLTIKPTPIGPTSVQSTTAHVITRKILWLEAAISEALEAAGCTVRVPALEDNEAISLRRLWQTSLKECTEHPSIRPDHQTCREWGWQIQ